MTRHTIPPQTNPPYTNGHYETPLEVSGVSLHRPTPVQKPTVFPPDLPMQQLGPLLYGLQRFHLGGAPFPRYLTFFWFAVAGLAFLGVLPGRWITIALALLLWIGQIVLLRHWERQHYVSFTPAPSPALNDAPLETSEKLPIYATGLLNVEGRYRSYSATPGFYRTFATGEHAVLCRVEEQRFFALGKLPPEDVGMWYAFFNPTDIEQLTWGSLQFGPTTYPAIAVQYRLEIPPSPRRKQPEMRQELLYLATPELQDAQRLYVDLLSNLPADKIVTSLSATT